MVDSICKVVRDTTILVSQSDLITFYKDLIEVQSNQFSILATVIGVVFAAVVGATWWWNYKGAKAQITEEVSQGINKINELYRTKQANWDKKTSEIEKNYNDFKVFLQESANKQIDDKMKACFDENIRDFDNKIDVILKQYEEKLNSLQNNVDQSMLWDRAELSRLFALYNDNVESYQNAFIWWLDAIRLYKNLSDGELMQVSVNAALNSLKEIEQQDMELDDLEEHRSTIESIVPNVFTSERDKMIKLIDKLKAKEKKQ